MCKNWNHNFVLYRKWCSNRKSRRMHWQANLRLGLAAEKQIRTFFCEKMSYLFSLFLFCLVSPFFSWLPSKCSILILYYLISCRISNVQYLDRPYHEISISVISVMYDVAYWKLHVGLICSRLFSFFGVTR